MKKNVNGFIIGIDSGGTKCELLITDKDKNVLFNRSYKGIHYSIAGVDVYSSRVCEFIKDALISAKLGLKNCISLCIGIAGAREDKDRANLKKAFEKKLKLNIVITTDAMTALYGAFEGDDGIILISGTGSVLYGYSRSKITRIGGWGRIIGDEGSGYWIGKRALNEVSKEYDNPKLRSSLLSKELNKAFGINKDTIVEKVFSENFEIQKIAPVVIKLANEKCMVCKMIVDEAVDGLMEHIRTFLKVRQIKSNIKIAFIGSIIENKNLLSDNLKKEIKKLKNVEVVLKKHPPVFGAVLLAFKIN